VTPKLTWRRRLAQGVLRYSAMVLPSARASWAAAMCTEAGHIANDREALSWALGSLHAAYAERLRALRMRRILSIRSLAALWIIMFIVSSAFNMSIALATRLRYQNMASAMGSLVDGFHYNRFVPLADAMPIGLFLLMGLAVALFTVSLWLNLRRRPAAFGSFCSAVGLSLGIWLYELGIPAYVQAMSPQHLWRNGICFALTAGLLSVARFSSSTSRPSAPRWRRSQH
jgi:hypothetical protein